MTWLLRISFSLLLAIPCVSATFSGKVDLADSRDPGVRKRKDYSGVVVWLEPLKEEPPAGAPRTVRIVQKDKKFVPHILAIPTGTIVEFPNYDPIFHNAFSNFSGQPFDTGLYPPGTSQKVLFRRSGIVRVFCNIHSSMSAVIVVTKTPYVAVTSRTGEFRVENVPQGEYVMKVFHERASEATLRSLERAVTVGKGDVALPLLRISELGYLEVPHKNKFGNDYPPAPDERALYPGGRR